MATRYRIVGRLKGKKYTSKSYPTEAAALKAGYKKVYMKDGNTKRKNGLRSWTIEKVTSKRKG